MFTDFHRHYAQKISGIFKRKLCGDNDVCLYWCSSPALNWTKAVSPERFIFVRAARNPSLNRIKIGTEIDARARGFCA